MNLIKKLLFCTIISLIYILNLFSQSSLEQIIDKQIRYNKWDIAKTELENYIRSYPSDSEGYRLYGIVLYELKLFDEAIIAIRNAINFEKSDEKKGELYYNLGLNYFAKGLKNIALEMFELSTALNKTLDLPYYFKGLIYYENKEPEKAISNWRQYTLLTTNSEKRAKMQQIVLLYEKQIQEEKLRLEEEKKKREELMKNLLKEIETQEKDTKSLEADKKKVKQEKIEFEELK